MDTAGSWAEVRRLIADIGWNIATGLGSRLSPLNLLSMLALCLVLWRVRKPAVSFLAWVFPARVYRNPSFRVDLQIYLVNLAISLVVVVNGTALATGAAAAIGTVAGAAPLLPGPGGAILSALVVFMAADLVTYWYHRLHHDWSRLWPIHALHHSAEDLSPVTAYRHHPLFFIVALPLYAVATGVLQAVLLVFITGSLDIVTLAGTNLFYALFNLFASNLRHSHIWLRFPRPLEHVFISPAMHQCHHSVEPRHHNRNYGEVLSLWDWMFGTLYLPDGEEVIRFGLGDSSGQPLPQPHPTLRAALVEPLQRLVARRRP